MSKKTTQIILKILVSFTLFAIIFSRVDIKTVLANFQLLNLNFIPLLVLFIVLNYVIGAFRWKALLVHGNSEKVTIGQLIRFYFVGAFFNNFMPTSVGGDVYKVFALGNKIGNKTDAFTSTFIERFTGVIALVLISYFGLVQTLDFWIAQLPATISSNAVNLFLFKFLVFFGFWIATVAGFLSLKVLAQKVSILQKVYNSLLAYKQYKRVLFGAFLTSFVIQFLAIFTQYFIFTAMGIDLPLSYSLFIFPVITLASFFIPSLNGLGVQDFLYANLFLSFGVTGAVGLSASFIYHLLRLFVSLFGGILYAFDKSN